ncbi:MAG: YicC/YloC family endoribonuclease [Pseudomonadota bacterium]
MALKSMTGFASDFGEDETCRWTWELRSVNGRGLEVRMRLPPGFEGLEAKAKPMMSAVFARGNISAHLSLRRTAEAATLRVDPSALQMVMDAAEQLRAQLDGPAPRAEALLALRGVLTTDEVEEAPDRVARRGDAILESLKTAVVALSDARAGEGRAMAAVLVDILAEIDARVAEVEAHPSRTPEHVRQKIAAAIERLTETTDRFDEDRLHQEAVLIATRADVEEEIQRLKAHLVAARDHLNAGAPVGRQLDFLAQEFNREVNTICSKSNDAGLSALGLSLKSLIERFREQVQNVE